MRRLPRRGVFSDKTSRWGQQQQLVRCVSRSASLTRSSNGFRQAVIIIVRVWQRYRLAVWFTSLALLSNRIYRFYDFCTVWYLRHSPWSDALVLCFEVSGNGMKCNLLENFVQAAQKLEKYVLAAESFQELGLRLYCIIKHRMWGLLLYLEVN